MPRAPFPPQGGRGRGENLCSDPLSEGYLSPQLGDSVTCFPSGGGNVCPILSEGFNLPLGWGLLPPIGGDRFRLLGRDCFGDTYHLIVVVLDQKHPHNNVILLEGFVHPVAFPHTGGSNGEMPQMGGSVRYFSEGIDCERLLIVHQDFHPPQSAKGSEVILHIGGTSLPRHKLAKGRNRLLAIGLGAGVPLPGKGISKLDGLRELLVQFLNRDLLRIGEKTCHSKGSNLAQPLLETRHVLVPLS